MQVGIVLILHPSPEPGEELSTLYEKFTNLINKVLPEAEVKLVEFHSKDSLREALQEMLKTVDQVIVCPLLARRGRHYLDIVDVCNDVGSRTGKKVEILPPLLEQQEVLVSIVSGILRHCEGFLEKYSVLPILASTGDVELMLEIESNKDIEQLADLVVKCRDLVVDDLRVVSFIDTKYLKPGTRVFMEDNVENFSFPPESLVVISSKVKAIERVLSLIEEGIKPSLVIATPPCTNSEEVMLKRRLLTLDVPVIISSGYRGGVHVAGALLNTLMRLASTSLS